jgi:GNAT superfamily N-acetyltransferase
MIRKKPAPHSLRGGHRFSKKIMLKQNESDIERDLIQAGGIPSDGTTLHAGAPLNNGESCEMPELSIRFVTRDDHEKWLPLWDGYNAFYGRSGATALAPGITAMTWSRFFDAYEPVHGLVAERGGELLGLTHYLFHRSTTAIEPLCYLQDLFTSENARGKGVGRALIEGVYRQAKLAGSPRVYWQTHETNLTARTLYDKVAERPGFIIYRKLI